MLRKLLSTWLLCCSVLFVTGQTTNSAYWDYINKYSGLAVRQMKAYKIPASIILAQGLLESGAGRSYLATKANNHFGIKCASDWKGPYVLKDDDYRNERFRSYDSPDESYRDHSLFLSGRSRYAFLFDYEITDYKAWAHGLKKAGYATNPNYAYSLISLIEAYRLHEFDRPEHKKHHRVKTEVAVSAERVVGMNNSVYYVMARRGDTFKALSKELGVSKRKLAKYNELTVDHVLQGGEILYLGKKKSKADKRYPSDFYEIKGGESVYDVAQKFGIKLSSLYRMNDLGADYVAKAGDRLKVK